MHWRTVDWDRRACNCYSEMAALLYLHSKYRIRWSLAFAPWSSTSFVDNH
jgi:hypothetical protein